MQGAEKDRLRDVLGGRPVREPVGDERIDFTEIAPVELGESVTIAMLRPRHQRGDLAAQLILGRIRAPSGWGRAALPSHRAPCPYIWFHIRWRRVCHRWLGSDAAPVLADRLLGRQKPCSGS